MTTVEGSGARAEESETKSEGSGERVGIHQGSGTEVGMEGTGAGSDWLAKRKERVGTGDDMTEGCRVELPFAGECYPAGG